MLKQLDLIRGATGAYVVAVPAILPDGPFILRVGQAVVELQGAAGVMARVESVHNSVTAALGALSEVALIEIVEDKPMPTTIRHWAHIEKVDIL